MQSPTAETPGGRESAAWATVPPNLRPRSADVLASLAKAPVSRVVVMTADVELRPDGSVERVAGRAQQLWALLDTTHAVRIVVREGTPAGVVAAALDTFRFEFREHWPLMVGGVPIPVPTALQGARTPSDDTPAR